MRKVLLRIQLCSLIIILPRIIIPLLIKRNLPQKEENPLILAIQFQAFLTILLAFLVLTYFVIHLRD